jgi:ABC-2 type transport system permease protein
MNALSRSVRRLGGLLRKESVQVVRDPSAILIAFVLPLVLLFLFAYAVSLDVRRVGLGVVLESDGAAAQSLAAAFAGTRYFAVTPARDRREVYPALVAGALRGYVVIPQDFETRLASGTRGALVQVITDGAQPNTANFVAGYAEGVVRTWIAAREAERGGGATARLALEPRIYFNPEIESRRFLIPGAIAIVMTLIGTLLTALVIAREWERGTMEALLATPTGIVEILLGKLLPYLALGFAATLGCTAIAILFLDVPLRGSWFALFALSGAFLVPALGQGLLISAAARNQFVASQIAMFSGFLPAFLLSGFLFEIGSMPAWIQAITYVLPARYYVASLQTVFLAGDVWSQFLPAIAAMLAIGLFFFAVTARRTRKSLEP